jgi:hypothetical protein
MNLDIPFHRLYNQRLSQTGFRNPADIVRWLGAVQAQDYAGAKWALGLRTVGLSDPDVDRAFADGSILRTHLMRPTWHFVAPEDIRWLLMLTGPRVHTASAFMYRTLEIDKPILKKSYEALEKALGGYRYQTRAELGSALENAGIIATGQRLGYIVMAAELDGIVCSGPRKGKQFTYALLNERVPAARNLTREEALAELTRRYFSTRGPATLHDFTWWSGLTMADAKAGMEMVRSEFVSEEIEGQTFWFPDSNPPPRLKYPTAYLLPNYDEYFIGFKDRSAIGKVAEKEGVRKDDLAFLAHIIILDGQVVGGWRRTLKKDGMIVEASLITRLAKDEEKAVTQAAEKFGEFLGLPVTLTMKESSDEQRSPRSF